MSEVLLKAQERITLGVKVIDTDHGNIHAGMGFTLENKMDIASGKVGALMLTPPLGIYVHLKRMAFTNSAGPVTVSLLENYTFAGGTAIAPANRNRVNGSAANTVCSGSTDATVTAGTGPLSLGMVYLPGSGVGSGRIGGAVSSGEEWILKPGRSYVLAIANAAGTGITVSYDLFFYEEGGA